MWELFKFNLFHLATSLPFGTPKESEEHGEEKARGEIGVMNNPLSTASPVVLLLIILCIPCSQAADVTATKVVDVGNDVEVTLDSYMVHGLSKDTEFCGRVRVVGISRLKFRKYSSAHRVTIVPSAVFEKLHSKIKLCFHRNSSRELCQCEEDEWRSLHKGIWSSIMSPYDDRYIDVKFGGDFPGSVSVTVEEEFQGWRMLFLALGAVLLLLAPVVSRWVPFYYSSSMAIGICLVIIVLLFQGMKLLPTGRKSTFYITIYGSVLGVVSFLLRRFSMLVNLILVNFGLSEEMHNPVLIFLVVGIFIAGAGLGYWLVRKFVISKDGTVDIGIAQFVKWAIRVVAVTFIFQSTLDTPLAMALLGTCLASSYILTSVNWHDIQDFRNSPSGSLWPWSHDQNTITSKRAEFFSRSGKNDFRGPAWKSLNKPPLDFSVKGFVSPPEGVKVGPSGGRARKQQDYYSTFHLTPKRKKFSKKEWEDFTRESTHQAVAELASSPEFTEWIVGNAERIQLLPDSSSSDETGSGSDSTDEHAVESSHNTFPYRLFKW